MSLMTTMHTIDEMKEMGYKNPTRRHEVLKSAVCLISEALKLPFPKPIVEYNLHMRGSDENAQQRSYYSSHRLDRRY